MCRQSGATDPISWVQNAFRILYDLQNKEKMIAEMCLQIFVYVSETPKNGFFIDFLIQIPIGICVAKLNSKNS